MVYLQPNSQDHQTNQPDHVPGGLRKSEIFGRPEDNSSGKLKGRGARSLDRLAVAERATIRMNEVNEDIPFSATRERTEGFRRHPLVSSTHRFS